MDSCVKCERTFEDGEGRFNFPSGAQCVWCGEEVNNYLKLAENALIQYEKNTGYKARIKFN